MLLRLILILAGLPVSLCLGACGDVVENTYYEGDRKMPSSIVTGQTVRLYDVGENSGDEIIIDWVSEFWEAEAMTLSIQVEGRADTTLPAVPAISSLGRVTFGQDGASLGPITFSIPGSGITFGLGASAIRIEVSASQILASDVPVFGKAQIAYGAPAKPSLVTFADAPITLAALGSVFVDVPLFATSVNVYKNDTAAGDILVSFPMVGSPGYSVRLAPNDLLPLPLMIPHQTRRILLFNFNAQIFYVLILEIFTPLRKSINRLLHRLHCRSLRRGGYPHHSFVMNQSLLDDCGSGRRLGIKT